MATTQCMHVIMVLLNFKLIIRMGKKHGVVVMVSDRLVWVFQKLLVYWHFLAQPSLGFKEYGLKKIKYPVNYCQLKTGNLGYSKHGLNKTGQQKIGKNITYSDESRFRLQHAQGKVRIWCKECKSTEPSFLVSTGQAAGWVMVSKVTRSQPNRASLGCGGTRHSDHGCPAWN